MLRSPLTLHVETFYPARRLYDRLRFKEVLGDGVYVLMSWSPDGKYGQDGRMARGFVDL